MENGGPARLYRNDLDNGNRSIRFELQGTASNRDAIGTLVTVDTGEHKFTRLVKSGSSYLSPRATSRSPNCHLHSALEARTVQPAW
jgi:hypothetical protein